MCPESPPPGAVIRRLGVFGAYSDHDLYQRNRVLVEQLSQLSESVEVLRPARGRERHSFAVNVSLPRRILSLAGDLWWLWRRRSRLDECDVVFIPYPPVAVLLMLRLSRWRRRAGARRSLLIVDAFLELYGTVVEDRKLFAPKSVGARIVKVLQRVSLRYADIVLIDTRAHAAKLRFHMGGQGPPIVPVPVGIDETCWRPLEQPPVGGPVTVLFWGTFIPLHGIDTIVSAAAMLDAASVPVRLHLVGDGQTAPDIAALLDDAALENIRWERRLLSTPELLLRASRAHIVLGIFGTSDKAGDVVPYKVHQGLALNRPVLTRRSCELEPFADSDRGLVLIEAGDASALAAAIERMAARICNGWKPATSSIFQEAFSRRVVRKALVQAIAK